MQNLEHSLQLKITVPIYLFWGEEDWLIDEYIRKLSLVVSPEQDPWSIEIFHGDDTPPEEILLAAQSGGLFSPKRLLVVRDAPWFRSKGKGAEESQETEGDKGEKDRQTKAFLAYCQDPNPDVVLVLTARNINRGTKVVKAVAAAGRVVEFTSPKGVEREIWLNNYWKQAGKQAERGVATYVSLMCGEKLGQLKSEADKLLLYCDTSNQIRMQDAEAVVSSTALAGVFQLTDLAANRKGGEAVEVLRRLLQQGEAAQKLLVLLAGQYRNMLCVKDMQKRGYSIGEIPAKLGLHPFVVKKCAAQSNRYTYRELMGALETFLRADIAAKSGEGDMDDLLEIALMGICAS